MSGVLLAEAPIWRSAFPGEENENSGDLVIPLPPLFL
jgi:hypothetical protein